MGVVGRLNQYASMLAGEFDDYSMSENLFLYSEQFNNAAWSVPVFGTDATVTSNQTIAPDGTTTADLISFAPDGTGQSRKQQNIGTLSGTFTASIFVKKVTLDSISLYTTTNQPPYPACTYVFSTDTITNNSATSVSRVLYPNGWVRISVTATVTSHVLYSGMIGFSTGTLYAWGAQLEVGSVATDYTPTTTTAITRVLSSTTNTNITGFSTYFSSGFSENVGAATTLVANVFPPYDLVYDDFGGTLFGAGQGRYMRQNTDKSVIVYNEIDEVSDFRDIVRTGLVLDLDAAQPLSYKGTGTAWNDLSGIGNNVSLIGSPSFNTSNGGSIVFNGSNYASGTSGSSFQFTSDFSVDGWIYPTTISATHVVFDTRVGGAPTTGIAIYINSSSQLVLYNGTTLYITSSTTLPINNWYHFCISRIGSTTTMYVNSSSVGSTNTLPTSLTDGNCFIARTNEAAINYFIGRISSIRSYKNKGLTLTEVLQNYNALKHRFGL